MRCTRVHRSLIVTLAVVVAPLWLVAADEEPTLGEAITNGKISLNLNYRYEDVDQENFDDRGRASTLRTTLSYRTHWWKGFSAFVEFEDVHDVGLTGDHNNAGAGSLWNGVDDRPVIADPELTEINQAYLEWKPIDSLPFRGGRQEIVVDNSRFIGNVGWRQNHQSFDAAKVGFNPGESLSFGYAYIDRQRTVTGASRPMNTSHLDGSFRFASAGTLRLYYLALDFDQEDLWGLSTTTVGVSFTGSQKLPGRVGLSYRLEYAGQRDGGNNPASVDADYGRIELGLKTAGFTVEAGYEVLGGSADEGRFTTPLATLHKFNGWADKFLSTPASGLTDTFVSVGAGFGKFKALAVYHDFSADDGGASFGTEIDASLSYTTSWKQVFAAKFAIYEADEWSVDTTKIWLWTKWGF